MIRTDDRLFCTDIGARLQIESQERRISSHHKRLEELYWSVLSSLDESGIRVAASAYQDFAEALESHMLLEEEVYFPALSKLRPDVEVSIHSLLRDHEALRELASQIRDHFDAGRRRDATKHLPELAVRISEHEVAEEGLIARITSAPLTWPGRSKLED